MLSIRRCALPDDALLARCAQDGAYTDCYYMDMPRAITLNEYVAAFYTTSLFKIERAILALVAGKPSTDTETLALALGRTSRFAVWRVEGRSENQLLLCDFFGRTKSWLMVSQVGGSAGTTRLYFGSAVMPKSRPATGQPTFGFAFHALHRFHHLYTKALMRAARMSLSSVVP